MSDNPPERGGAEMSAHKLIATYLLSRAIRQGTGAPGPGSNLVPTPTQSTRGSAGLDARAQRTRSQAEPKLR